MRSRWFVVGMTALLVYATAALPTAAQMKYEGPEDPIIEQMCLNAARALETYGDTRNTGEHGVGELVLIGLTILEVNKRYEGEVPKDHPLIQRAVETTLEMVNGSTGERLSNQNAMYTPCLALILLCEVDDQEYKPEIQKLVNYIFERQNDNGGWCYKNNSFNTDISQTQYCALALFIAKLHKINIDVQGARRALDCLTNFQMQSGSWVYHYTVGGTPKSRTDHTPSLHTSALGTVYVLGDLLQLTRRAKDMRIGAKKESTGLPPSVTVYIPPKPGEDVAPKDRPLVNFDRGKLGSSKARGNRWLVDNFTVNSDSWNYYYLYALERYAFFREQAEGSFAEVPNWYDQGVDHLRSMQASDGFYPRSNEAAMNKFVSTSLATLFLVRSSDLLVRPPAAGDLVGSQGFPAKGTLKLKNGRLVSQAAVKGVNDMLELLGDAEGEDARAILAGLKFTAKSIGEGKSRAERMALLQGMVMDASPIKRLIGVKVLAGEQNMDNVPALIYALGDPDLNVARHAHDGLRLVSRRIDAFPLPKNPTKSDYQVVKKQWTDWFLSIRPDAELLD